MTKKEKKAKAETEKAAEKEEVKMADQPAQAKGPEFGIRQIYIKNLSYEAPDVAKTLTGQWKPEVGLDLSTSTNKIAEDLYEVVLRITTTVKTADKTAFIIEVDQAGVFSFKDFAEKQLHYMLGSYCPNVLFPYAREMIASAAMRGGFPPLYLAPVNFDALYEQQMKKGEWKGK